MIYKRLFSKLHLAALAAMLVFFSTSSQAVLLGLSQQNPDFFASNLELSTSGTTYTGDLLNFQIDTTTYDVTGGLFELNLAASTISLSGVVVGLAGWSGSLLEGTILDFGFNGDPTDVDNLPTKYDFLFSVDSGAAAATFGSHGGTIIDMANPSSIVSDTFSVPAPAVFWLFGMGLVGLITAQKRKNFA